MILYLPCLLVYFLFGAHHYGRTRILRMIFLLEVLKFRYTWLGARAFVAFHLQELTIQDCGIITSKIPASSWLVHG